MQVDESVLYNYLLMVPGKTAFVMAKLSLRISNNYQGGWIGLQKLVKTNIRKHRYISFGWANFLPRLCNDNLCNAVSAILL